LKEFAFKKIQIQQYVNVKTAFRRYRELVGSVQIGSDRVRSGHRKRTREHLGAIASGITM